MRKIDRRTLRDWIKVYKNLKPGEKPKSRGRPRNEEFELAVLSECIIADHVARTKYTSHKQVACVVRA